MKINFPISDYYRNFFENKLHGRVHLVIDGIPFFADFDHCSISAFTEDALICTFNIDCEVNGLDET